MKLRNERIENILFSRGVTDHSYENWLLQEIKSKGRGEPLRWAVTCARKQGTCSVPYVDVEATIIDGSNPLVGRAFSKNIRREKPFPGDKPRFVHIVPTGFRAAIGGSLGDAMPVNTALSQLGILISHPNTFNAGPLNLIDRESMLYLADGYALDQWAQGRIVLERVKSNRIGVILDCGPGDDWALMQAMNQINGFRAQGAEIAAVELTEKLVGGKAVRAPSGAFVGEVENVDAVLEAGERLVKQNVDAIAVFTFVSIEEGFWVEYFAGNFPNPVGGVEAIISHLLLRQFCMPAAHAPILTLPEVEFMQSRGAARPEAAIEAVTPFYVWSVLRGLQFAPRLVSSEARTDPAYHLPFTAVSAVICPASCMGGIPMMRAEESAIPIIGVRQNETIADVRAEVMGYKHVVEVEDYLAAVGLLALTKSEGEEYDSGTMKNLTIRFSVEALRVAGEKVCREAGIDPRALLRPLASLAPNI